MIYKLVARMQRQHKTSTLEDPATLKIHCANGATLQFEVVSKSFGEDNALRDPSHRHS